VTRSKEVKRGPENRDPPRFLLAGVRKQVDMQGKILANRFRLDEQLGKGGMGSVWIAEHLTLRSNVAVKLMDPAIAASQEGADRFRREAQAAASLRSAHVVQVLDYGVDEGMPFLVMELLHGENLGRCLEREQRLTPERTLHVMTQVARAVGRAHAGNIIHRDLKPDNVFLVQEDGQELVKVLDFGIAKTREANFGGLETRTGMTIGTPYYMSPEQAEGKKEVDHRTDLWAMAVITSECLTGVRPFSGETWGELLLNICARPMPVPSAQGPVPAGFDAWFAKATNRDIEQRFASAQEQAAALQACIERGVAPAVVTGRQWGQKGATVVHTGPIIGLPAAQGFAPLPAGNTGPGQALDVSSTSDARPRKLGLPLTVAAIAFVVLGFGATALGIGALKWWGGRGEPSASASQHAAPPVASEPAPASGGSPAIEQGPGISIGGAPEPPSRNPFDEIVPTIGGAGGAAGRGKKDEKGRERPQTPGPGPQGGAAHAEAPKGVLCFSDPFTGAVKLASKGRPPGAATFACKQNPFTGQYQKL
jgi:hypothetical protein